MSRNVNKGFVCIWKIRHFNFYNSEKDHCISTPVFETECLRGSKWMLHLFHDGSQVGCYITHEGPRKSNTEVSVRYELTNPEGDILVASEQFRYTFAKSKFSDKYFMIQRTVLTQKMCFWFENTVTLRCYMDYEDDVMLPVSTCQVTTDFSERFSFLWPFNHSNELVKKQMRLAGIPVEISFKHMDNSLDFNFLSNIKNEEELFAFFELSLVNSEGSMLVSIPCMSEFRQNNKNDFCTLNFCIPKTEICDEIKIKCEILNAFKSMVKYPKKYLGREEIAESNISKANNIVALRKGVSAFKEKESQQFQVEVPRSFHEKRSEISGKASQQFQDGASQNFNDKEYHLSVKGSQQFNVNASQQFQAKGCQQFQVKGSQNFHGIVNQFSVNMSPQFSVNMSPQFSVNVSPQFEANSSQQFQTRGFQNFHEKRYQFSEKVSQQFQGKTSQQFQVKESQQFQGKTSQQFQVKESQQFQDGGSQSFHEKGYHFSEKGAQQLDVKAFQQIQVKGSQNFHGVRNQFSINASQQFEANSSQQFQTRGFQNLHEKGYHFSANISQHLEVKQQILVRGSQNFHNEGHQFSEKTSQQLQKK